ncbi:MAG TPA: hypothetical protein VIF62_30480 [Labilithrix sp.]
MWQRSFVAMTVLAGGTYDDALASLEPGADALLGDLPTKLRDARRPVRAQALATVAHEIAVALAEVTLR